jgi:hypothetical protein
MKFLLSLSILLMSIAADAQPIDTTEWNAYMKNTRLHWDSLGTDYYDGIIAGNGKLGVNAYREGEKAIRFDVGRSDVTDQRPHYPDSMFTQQLVSRPRLPIGKMVIRTEGKILGADLDLDIYNAIARGSISTSNGRVELFFVVPSGEDIIHIEASELGGEKIFCEWVAEQSISPRISFGRGDSKLYKYQNNPDFEMKDSAGYGICYQPLLTAGEYATVWKHAAFKEKHVIDVAVGYSTDELGKARPEAIAAIKRFQSKPLDQVMAKHKGWWNAYFKKSFISIPDKRVETYYWLQLYKLASATREDKPIIDLMGPWFTSKTPWPGIWWNLNQQLTYSPMFASNHLELTKPLFALLHKNRQNLINNVPEQWRNDASALGRISSFDMVAPLNQHDLRKGQFEPGDLVWTMLYYYRYYQYSGDKDELKTNIYPLLKRTVNYLMHLLNKDENGIYHLVKSHSPEYADAEDAHYSLSGLIWGLQTLLHVEQLLKLNDPDKTKWSEVLQRLTPLHTSDKGFMIGRNVDLTSSHRHYSHLLAIYPYRLLDMKNPAHREMTTRSINHWHSMPAALAGYSYTGASAMYSLLGEGDKSIKYLNDFLNRHAEPGGLYAESGPCFETPMAFATSLLEMMIQSDDGNISILPAIPSEWREMSFKDLAAEGAFRVSAVMYDAILQQVQVKSLAGNRCSLDMISTFDFDIVSDKRGIVVPVAKKSNGHVNYSFDTKAGETITLKRKNMSTAKDLLVHFKEGDFKWGLNKTYLKKGNLKDRPFF